MKRAIMSKLSFGLTVVLVGGAVWLVLRPPVRGVLGSYSTCFEGRSESQQVNAVRAARALDGTVIMPGEVLSFNKTVGSWTADRGYVKAPVSFSGELLPAWGGGVCQTSTTLYNAALIAGLEIVERHRHLWVPSYVPPGRDAAVAQFDIDLRLRNPYPWPVHIEARRGGNKLGFVVVGRARGPMARVATETRDILSPQQLLHPDDHLPIGERHILNPGRPGCRVSVYRLRLIGKEAGQRELVSQDTYQAMNRIVRVGW